MNKRHGVNIREHRLAPLAWPKHGKPTMMQLTSADPHGRKTATFCCFWPAKEVGRKCPSYLPPETYFRV